MPEFKPTFKSSPGTNYELVTRELSELMSLYNKGSRFFRNIALRNGDGMFFPLDMSLIKMSLDGDGDHWFAGYIETSQGRQYFTAIIEKGTAEFAMLTFCRMSGVIRD